jgi:transcriptional regulator with XRE-family HTH domain
LLAEELSLRELAGLAGVSNAYPSLIESGQRENIGADILAKLAGVLGTTIDYLLTGAGGAPSQRRVRAAVKAARDRRDGTPALSPDPDEKTPAESPAPKRLSSRPPPPAELVDAVDLDAEGTPTVVTEPPALESAPDVPPVKLSELNVRTDTNPDPRAGEVLERTPKPLTVLDVRLPNGDRAPTPSPDKR